MRSVWRVCLGVCLLSIPGSAQSTVSIEQPAPDVVVFNIAGASSGSLEFDGSVRRLDKGDAWEFHTHLFAMLHAGRSPNPVETVRLTAWQFAATNVRPDGTQGPVEQLAVHTEPMELELRADSERMAIPDVTFQIAKQVVGSAKFAGIGVVGNQGLLWPVFLPVSLIDTFR